MKIAQLVMARQFRGAEIFASQLSAQLNSMRDVEVRYISLYKASGSSFTPAVPFADLEADGGKIINFVLVKKLADVLKEFDPDIVQANAGDTLKYAVLVRSLHRMKYKIVFRNASTISKYIKSRSQRLLYRAVYKRVDFVASVSATSMQDLLSLYPFCRTKIKVIPNGIELRKVTSSDLLSKKHVNLLHVGGFTFEKNHEGLLRIFGQVRLFNNNIRLFLIGEGPLRETIMQLVEKMGLADSVVFLGVKSNVLEYIASADVLLLPSRIEGMPAVILEAMFCRTPVVAYRVGGIAEVVEHERTGWLVEAGDETQFVSCIQKALRKDEVASVLENAYQRVVKSYDNAAIASSFLSIYNHLMKGDAQQN